MTDVNPYEPPDEVSLVDGTLTSEVPMAFRILTGMLVVSGFIYLITIFWLITIPGALIWLGWISIAGGKDTVHLWAFWTASLVWNACMAAFIVGERLEDGLEAFLTLPSIHSLAAVVVSAIGIWLSTRQRDGESEIAREDITNRSA